MCQLLAFISNQQRCHVKHRLTFKLCTRNKPFKIKDYYVCVLLTNVVGGNFVIHYCYFPLQEMKRDQKENWGFSVFARILTYKNKLIFFKFL